MGRQMGFYELKVWGGGDAEMTFLTLGTSCSRALVTALVGVKQHTTILSTVVRVA